MPYGYDSAKVKRSGLKYFCDNILVSLEIAIILLIPYEVANFSKHLLHPAFLASFYFLTLLVLLLEAIFKIMNIVPDYYKYYFQTRLYIGLSPEHYISYMLR